MVFTFPHKGSSIEYSVRHSQKARQYRIAVLAGGRCVVTLPRHGSVAECHRFVQSKAQWIARSMERMRSLPVADPRHERAGYNAHKEKALMRANALIRKFAPLLGVFPSSVSIGWSRSRWGSCSRKGALRFSWRIALLEEPLAEYLVVHELCHLKHFHHKARFWDLVGSLIVDWQIRRRRLRLAEGMREA